MKSLVTAAALVCALAHSSEAFAQAENYQLWRVDTGLVGNYQPATGAGGFGAFVEPKFNALDQLSVGLRIEGNVLFGASFDSTGESVSVNAGVNAATLAKAEWFFTNHTVRPFAGFGLGMYAIGSQSVDTNPDAVMVTQQAGRYFGIAPQLGVNFGRFRLAATYHLIVAAQVEITQTVGGTEEVTKTRQDFLSIDIGIQFGGGKKKDLPPPSMPPDEPW